MYCLPKTVSAKPLQELIFTPSFWQTKFGVDNAKITAASLWSFMTLDMNDISIFSAEQIFPKTYRIKGEGCDSYLLIAKAEAVMIDSGMSTANIRTFAERIAGVPVRRVINTHSHFDHTGGNGFFDVIYGTEGISRSAKNSMEVDSANYPMEYTFTIVHDKEIIEIEGRPLEIILLDCHSPENIAILDPTYKLLFPGDELESGQVLLLPGFAEKKGQLHSKPAASVETYLHAMQKLKSFSPHFTQLCPGHNGAPLDVDYVDRYIETAQRVLDGHEGKTDVSSPTYNRSAEHFPYPEANYRRAEWRGASLVYCADLIWDKDYQKNPCQHVPATWLHEICAEHNI
jgi:glyoxylase-like metal-dependent hydrolase (beta-lactamase superfamily II)